MRIMPIDCAQRPWEGRWGKSPFIWGKSPFIRGLPHSSHYPRAPVLPLGLQPIGDVRQDAGRLVQRLYARAQSRMSRPLLNRTSIRNVRNVRKLWQCNQRWRPAIVD